jgi:beta-glucanase (GH16 family)
MAPPGGPSAPRWLAAGIALLLAVQVVVVTTVPARATSEAAAVTTPAASVFDLLGRLFRRPRPTTTTSTSSTTTSSTSSTTTSSSTSSTSTTVPPVDPDDATCGPTIEKPDGTDWICTFADGFTGSTLDASKWNVQTTLATGFHSGPECFMDSPNNIAIGDGVIRLTVRQEAQAFTCRQGDYQGASSYSTPYTSGMVTTFGKFSQTYGRFEVRAKMPTQRVQGLQTSFWLWPVDAWAYGPWPMSGEIDFAEWYSKYPDLMIPYIHYFGDGQNVTSYNCKITAPEAFHTYAVEWTPQAITIIYDGKVCLVNTWAISLPAHPAPFDRPFTLSLTQALGIADNAFQPGVTPLPATTTVDYARIWR